MSVDQWASVVLLSGLLLCALVAAFLEEISMWRDDRGRDQIRIANHRRELIAKIPDLERENACLWREIQELQRPEPEPVVYPDWWDFEAVEEGPKPGLMTVFEDGEPQYRQVVSSVYHEQPRIYHTPPEPDERPATTVAGGGFEFYKVVSNAGPVAWLAPEGQIPDNIQPGDTLNGIIYNPGGTS